MECWKILQKIEKKRKEIKIFPCFDCGKNNFKVEKTICIVDNNSLLISGTQPPIGFILKSTWFNNEVRCSKCQKRYDEENDYEG